MELHLGGVDIKTIGYYGDLAWTTRYGEGACGMFEASWTMPLPPGFEHPLLRRGTLVELFDGPWRFGSPLVMSEPAKGTGVGDPWQITCTGIGREVEGDSTFYSFDGVGNITTEATTAVHAAIARGLPVAGYQAGFPAAPFDAISTDSPFSIGTLLTAIGNAFGGQRWGVGQDNLFRFYTDPTAPAYHVTPGAAALGTADDDYATVVYVRYADSGTSAFETVFAPPTPSVAEQRFRRREFLEDLTSQPAMSAATAQGIADGILATVKGRLGWANGLTLTSNEILTDGGVPADLSKVSEDVAEGCMVRLEGIFDDLLEVTGQTWLDIIVGEAKCAEGASTIALNPLGLAPRDLAAVSESITRMALA